MRKTSFYSLHQGNKAILHDGYLDTHFWYYKHYGKWFAIYPETGTAVAIEKTRKAAAQKAHLKLEAVVKFCANHPKWIDIFNEACRRAVFHED